MEQSLKSAEKDLDNALKSTFPASDPIALSGSNRGYGKGKFQVKQSDSIETSNQARLVAEVLTQVLADTFTVYLKTLNYHWNVEGGKFVGIHNLTDTQYHEMFEAIDVLAERVRAIGFYAPASYREYQQLTTIEEMAGEKAPTSDMISQLVNDHMQIVGKIKEGIEIVEKCKDTTTVDLLSARRNFHEQAAWMLRSICK